MNHYDLVMFDMDGTLMDSREFHQEVFYRFLNQYVGPVTRPQVRRGMGDTVREIFDSVGVPETELEMLFRKLDDFCRNEVDGLAAQIPVVPGTRELLEALKQKGIKRALLTNSMEAVSERMLAANGLLEYFDAISGADFYSVNKIERCSRLEKRMGAKRVLYVGDTEKDIELAHSMGYDCCFAETEFGWYADREYIFQVLKPEYAVTDIKEIRKFV